MIRTDDKESKTSLKRVAIIQNIALSKKREQSTPFFDTKRPTKAINKKQNGRSCKC